MERVDHRSGLAGGARLLLLPVRNSTFSSPLQRSTTSLPFFFSLALSLALGFNSLSISLISHLPTTPPGEFPSKIDLIPAGALSGAHFFWGDLPIRYRFPNALNFRNDGSSRARKSPRL